MNRLVALFLDRLVERFTVLMAGVLSSRVERLQATALAEQQSELEDLARTYEADGKCELAKSLRQRAARLSSSNLSAEAEQMLQQLTADQLRLPEQPCQQSAPALTEQTPTNSKKRSGKGRSRTVPSDDLGDIS